MFSQVHIDTDNTSQEAQLAEWHACMMVLVQDNVQHAIH